jgi:RHS repeat-associated protein
LKRTDSIPSNSFDADFAAREIGAYRYGFQNQEHDNELWSGAVSYKYRVEDPRLGRFFSVDPLAAKYPHNSVYAFSENRVVDAVELEGLEKVIIIGGADVFSQGESTETMLTLANDIREFGSNNGLISLEVKTFVQSANDPMSTAFDVISYLKESADTNEPLIIYGYSMGGANAIKIVNWMAENLPEYQVDLLVTVDPAVMGESVQYVKDNVDEVRNYFQSDRNYLNSEGFVIFPEEGNDKTYVDNVNYDRKKSEAGLGAHGKMDEDTLKEAETLICNELIED